MLAVKRTSFGGETRTVASIFLVAKELVASLPSELSKWLRYASMQICCWPHSSGKAGWYEGDKSGVPGPEVRKVCNEDE